jgi:soluble lytic murein transglycosylase-like protein
MRCWLLACAALGLLFVPGSGRADIYRYVDRDGVIHYTNVQQGGRGWQQIYRGGRKIGPALGQRSGAGRSDPERFSRYDAHIREGALLYQLPESFIRAVMTVESNFHPDVISPKGAIGLMQLMPETAASMGVVDPFDPRQNVLGGSRFLRVLANEFNGDLVLTVAAYNAGQNAVRKHRGIPPYDETRRYVRKVLHHYYSLRAGEQATAVASAAQPRKAP